MNHIYKSIFNKALGVFTAVPEFASAHGKGSERTVVGRVVKGAAGFAASALAISIGLALTSTSAVAYPGIYINDRQAGNCLAINDTAVANLGVGTILDVNSTPGSVELKVPGTYAPQTGITPSYYNAAGSARPCAAIGNSTVDNRETQTNRTLFYGGPGAATEADEVNNENNGAKNLTLGGRLDVNSGIIGVGDRGTNGAGATNSIRMGMGTALSDDNKKTDAVTIGVNAGASAKHATAIGSATTAKTGYSTALGYQAQAGDPAVTLLNGEYATAIGGLAKALHAQATAVGAESVAAGVGQTSIGAYAGKNGTGDQVRQSYGVFIGRFAGSDNQNPNAATEGGNNYGVSIGESAGRYGQGGTRNTAIGEQAGQYLKGSHNIAMGTDAGSGTATDKLQVNSTTSIGNSAKALTSDSVAIGTSAQAGKADKFSGERAVAVGYHAQALGSAGIAIGEESSTTNGHNGVAIGAYSKTENEKAISIGAFSTASGAQSIVMAGNYDTNSSGPVSVASGTRATVIGAETTVSGNNSLAIGDKNTVASNRTYAIGNNINVAAGADDSLVFGTRVTAGARNSIAMGKSAQALAGNATAIGADAQAKGIDSIAMGLGATVEDAAGFDGIAIGTRAKAKEKGMAVGAYSQADGVESGVFANAVQGKGSTASGRRSSIIGVESTVSGDNSVAIGDKNTVASASTYVMGNNINVKAGADDALAFGTRASVGGNNAIAMGNTATASASGSVAISNQSKAKTTYSIALGQGAVAGDDSAGALNNGEAAIAIGREASANVYNGIALGKQATVKKDSSDGIAIGSETKVNAYKGTAIGAFSEANGSQSLAMGNNKQGQSSIASGDRSQVYGVETTVSGNNSVAIGDTNKVASASTYVMGNNINVAAGADDSLAFGTRAAVGGANTVAIGANANAAQANSVALGAGSATSAAHTTGDYTLNTSYTAAGEPNAANGTVSVGSAGKERQIQNVAAGVISATSTDAINGSQLYATNNYLSNLAGGVKNVLGGDAAVDNAGNVTMSNIGDTGKGNVNDAIAAANTKVAAGDNITVTPTDNADGSKTYTVATKKDLVVDSVKAGDSTLNTDGLTITGGPSVKKDGINAGNKKITGVANGDVAAGSTDAVNGGQLAAVKAKADSAVQDVKSGDENALTAVKDPNTNIVTVTPKLSGDLVDTNGNITAPTTPEEKGKLVTAGTVAEALANTHFVVDTKATDGELDAASQADQKIKASNKVTLQAGKNLKAKQTNGANGAEVEFSLKDSISLKEVKVGEGSANEVVLNNNGVNVAGNTYINKDGLNANDKKITNVAPGAVTAASKDAVNGSQLYNVANNVKDLIGPDAKIDPATGKVTVADPAKGIGETGKGNIGDAIKHVNDAAKAAAETAAKHTTVVEGKNVKVTKGKNAAGGDEYTVATKDDLDVTSVTAGNTTVNTNGLTITGGPSVTRGGIDAGNRIISGVKAGDVSATSQEAVNGSQLHATNTKLDGVKAKADTAVQDVKSGDENALTAVKDPNTNIVTVTPKLSGDLVDANGNITAPTTPADKGKLVTAGTVADALANTHFVVDTKATDGELDAASQADQKIKAGNKVTLQAGKNLKAKQTNGANGAQVEFSLKDSISLKEVTAGEGANQVVLNDKGVNVGGNTYINNDGLNANGNKITNVADGVDPTDAVNKSQLDAVKGVADSAVKSVDVANGEQNLVVDNTDPKNPKLSLKKDLTVDSVKAGDSTLNTDGLTIAGGPSVKKDGINAGDKTITNVAPGAVTPTSKDAVNGSQLYNVANNVKDLIGPDATIDPATGKVTVADPAKGIGETGKGNIGDAIKHVNDAAKAAADTAKKHTTVEQGDNIVVEESLNADGGKHYKVSTAKDLNVDSVKAGDTTVNNDGVTIAGGPSVTKGGINAGGNTITNVADGVNPNDAVNKGQLDAVKGVADSAVKSVKAADGEQNLVVDNTDPKNPKLSLKKDLTVDSVKAGDTTVNNDGLTIAGGPSVKKDGIDAGDKKITNVAAGDVAENSKDAVNGGQLYDVAKNVADLVGPDAKIDPATGKVTVADPAKGIGETGKGNIGDAIKHVNDLAKNAADTAKKHTTVEQGDNIVVEESTNAEGGKHYKVSTAKNLNVDSVKAGDTTVNNDGVTINNGPSMTKDGINANNTKVTNVADGVDAADAVNKGQLDKVDTKVSNVAQNVVNVLGGDATVNGNGDITMSNIGETGKGNINDAIKSVNDLAKKAAAEKTSVKAKEGRSNVTVTEGVNAAGGHEYTVDVERSVTNAGSDYVTVTNNHDADTNTTTYTVDVSAKTKASLAKADSAVQGLTSKDGNLNFTKGPNGNVEVSFNDNLNVKNVTTDRVQVANGPSMSKDGINAAGKAISNVANGNVAADSKDAVNGGQLHETAKSVADVIGGGATVKDGKVVAGQNGIGNTGQNTVHGAIAAINQNTVNNFNQIRGDLRKMDRDLRGGIAGALATAGLPQAFRPGKSMVAAAASTYRGQSGLAIGVSRISDNGKVILKVTGNTNSRGDFGGTIGAGYQW